MKTPQNISASVRQRLLNRSKADNRSFNELLQYYAMERFLYRLSLSDYAQHYILKGALMLRAWNSPEFRPTMDIDMLGKTGNEEGNITSQIRDILAVEVEPDGLAFDSESIQTERITEDADYEGIRVRFRGALDTARINIQIDIGFGDIVYPGPEKAEIPCMLDSPAPSLLCYSRESAIAEKFEAMIKLGMLNSRMKDFFDIWLLSHQFDFDGSSLQTAIRKTFEKRGTTISSAPIVFLPEFSAEPTKHSQWRAFIRKNRLLETPEDFQKTVDHIASFLGPIVDHLTDNKTFLSLWKASGPWR